MNVRYDPFLDELVYVPETSGGSVVEVISVEFEKVLL